MKVVAKPDIIVGIDSPLFAERAARDCHAPGVTLRHEPRASHATYSSQAIELTQNLRIL